MSQDSGSTIRIAYRPDGDTGPWNILRRADGGPTITVNTEGAGENIGRREETDEVRLSDEVGGDVNFNFSAQSFDDFIAGAFCNDWDATTGVVNAGGSEDKAFELLISYQQIDKHVHMTGMRVSTLALNIEADAKITGTVGFMGTGYDENYDASGDTFNDPTTTAVMSAATNGGDVMIDGATLAGTCISTFNLSLDNQYQAQYCIGRATPGRQIQGMLDVTGSINFAFTSDGFALWNKTITRVPITTSFEMSDDTTTYLIETAKTYMSGDMPIPSGSDPAVAELDAQHRLDVTAGYSVRITRTPAVPA